MAARQLGRGSYTNTIKPEQQIKIVSGENSHLSEGLFCLLLRDGRLQTTDLPLHLPYNLLPSAHSDAYGHCDSARLRFSPGDYKLPV